MGAMVTLPEHLGKGLAKLSMTSLASHIKYDLDLVPYCNIMPENTASLRVAEQVGLERIGTMFWMMWTPNRFKNRPTDYRFIRNI